MARDDVQLRRKRMDNADNDECDGVYACDSEMNLLVNFQNSPTTKEQHHIKFLEN